MEIAIGLRVEGIGMEKIMKITIMGYIGITTIIHSFVPS